MLARKDRNLSGHLRNDLGREMAQDFAISHLVWIAPAPIFLDTNLG
jgi:hypothetical protein